MKYSAPLLIVSVHLLIVLSGAAGAGSVPPEINIATKHGDVTFHHANHQIWAKGNCDLCHHQGAGTLKCGKCHNGSCAKVEREVIHDMCRSCHLNNPSPLTPRECGDCHAN